LATFYIHCVLRVGVVEETIEQILGARSAGAESDH